LTAISNPAPERLSHRLRIGDLALRWLVLFAAARLWVVGNDGPDFGQYIEWAYAALRRDIFALESEVLSPAGVPFNVVSSGPGILFTTVYRALGDLVAFRNAAYLTGWLAALVFWVCSFAALRAAAAGERWLTWFGCGLLFIGTQAGWYSHVYSTEVFALSFTAAVWALAAAPRQFPLLACAAAGSLTALLFLVRPYLALYALPPLGLVLLGGTSNGNRRPAPLFIRLGAAFVPLAAAFVQYCWVNRWMTGSFLRPPYVFGDFGFTSIDFLRPEIAAVLTHPLHGLLPYHPLYAVAFAALMVEMWRDRDRRLFYLATAVAVVLHVWVHAAWYVWWLGGGSFGMRGLVPAALPLSIALITAIRRCLEADDRAALVWIRCAVLACGWSFTLLLQGHTQFYTWGELLAAQRGAVWTLAGVAALWVCSWISHRSGAKGSVARTEIRGSAIALLVLVAWYLARAADARTAPLNLIAIVTAAALVTSLVGRMPTRVLRPLKAAALVLAISTLAGQAVLFARLAASVGSRAAAGTPPPRPFRYRAAAPLDEMTQTYAEYMRIPGFEDRKASLRRFLNWQQLEMSEMRPADRALAERVLSSLAADETAGGFLLTVTADNGVVKLISGDTREDERRRALELAAGVPGVVSVEDWMK
jgi:hypothetical protein